MDDQRVERRDQAGCDTRNETSGSATDSDQTKRGHSFISNNLEHQVSSSYKTLALMATILFGGPLLIGWGAYEYGYSKVTRVVEREVPYLKYDRTFTLYEKINEMSNEQIKMNDLIKNLDVYKSWREAQERKKH